MFHSGTTADDKLLGEVSNNQHNVTEIQNLKAFFAYPNAIVLISQLTELPQKVFSCQHPAPSHGVGAAPLEAVQRAVTRWPSFPY